MDAPIPIYKELLKTAPVKEIKEGVYKFFLDHEFSVTLEHLMLKWRGYLKKVINKIDKEFIGDYLPMYSLSRLEFEIDQCVLKAVEHNENNSEEEFLNTVKKRVIKFINEHRRTKEELTDFEFH